MECVPYRARVVELVGESLLGGLGRALLLVLFGAATLLLELGLQVVPLDVLELDLLVQGRHLLQRHHGQDSRYPCPLLVRYTLILRLVNNAQ